MCLHPLKGLKFHRLMVSQLQFQLKMHQKSNQERQIWVDSANNQSNPMKMSP